MLDVDTQTHFTDEALQAGLLALGTSPLNHGRLEMIVCRPDHGERIVKGHAELDLINGLVEDNWRARGSKATEDGSAHPDMQVSIMNSRVIQNLAGDRARWSLAGDQLFIDLDLSAENLPAGQRLAIGGAVLEITGVPHNGCAKFTERFGHAAIRFVNSPEGRLARRRGIFARVVQPGTLAVGDQVIKLETPH
jgi:hypothetical protein